MKVGNPITDVANAVNHAQLLGLPAIKYEREQRPDGMPFSEYKRQHLAGALAKSIEERRPTIEDCEVFMFPQIWRSTALGLGGMGCSSPRQANTVVIVCRKAHAASVYFAGQHAYTVNLKDPAVLRKLNDDIRDRRIASRKDAIEHYASGSVAVTEVAPEQGSTP
jgi:hypothetical protein